MRDYVWGFLCEYGKSIRFPTRKVELEMERRCRRRRLRRYGTGKLIPDSGGCSCACRRECLRRLQWGKVGLWMLRKASRGAEGGRISLKPKGEGGAGDVNCGGRVLRKLCGRKGRSCRP